MNKTLTGTRQRILKMTYTALFAVIIAVCSWICIYPPTGVPFTLQTFGVFCAVGLLGGKLGSISVLIFIALGAVGVPVFSGFQGGLGTLLGMTGGYILGFLASALIYWLITSVFGKKLYVMAIAMVIGLIACYAFGTVWFMYVYGQTKASAISLYSALAMCVFPYIIPDLLKIALAVFISKAVGKFVKIK